MTIGFNVKANVRAMTRDLNRVQKRIVPQSTARALNRTAKAVQGQAVKVIAKDIGLTQRDVRRYLIVSKAIWTRLTASVQANRNKRVAVHLLGARRTNKGVTYRSEGGARKLIPGAFFIRHGVFKRTGKGRFPVVFLRTVSINHVFVKEAVMRVMDRIAETRFVKEFQSDLKFRLRRKGLL